MTTKPPPQDEAEALAIKAIVDESGILTRLNALDVPSFAKAMVKTYLAGQSSLLERLAKEGSEFDDNEALDWIKSKTVSNRMDIKFAVDVARWQHTKLSPLIAYWKKEAEPLSKWYEDGSPIDLFMKSAPVFKTAHEQVRWAQGQGEFWSGRNEFLEKEWSALRHEIDILRDANYRLSEYTDKTEALEIELTALREENERLKRDLNHEVFARDKSFEDHLKKLNAEKAKAQRLVEALRKIGFTIDGISAREKTNIETACREWASESLADYKSNDEEVKGGI